MPKRKETREVKGRLGKLYTIAEVESLSGFSRTYIYECIREGRLKAYKVGRRYRFKEEDVMEWLGLKQEEDEKA